MSHLKLLPRVGIPLFVFLLVCSVPASAKRMVKGQIKDAAGSPMSGLKVRAWDSDPGPTDDFMGEAITDAQGRYSISYHGGHWDPFPHNITKWRPDIYINVLLNVGGDWVRVHKSKIFEDWKLADDLVIDVQLSEQNRWISGATTFDPVVHGFPFANDARKICAAPTCDQEHWAGQYLRKFASFRWALCGGMSLTALRRFRKHEAVSDFSPQLKTELVKAQLDTVSPTVWAKFIEWQAKPTKPHPPLGPHTIGSSTIQEWPRLRSTIDSKAPIILGLVRVQSTNPADASNNHQVLAIGYRYNELTRQVEIFLYDPNHPKVTSKISMNVGLPGSQIKAKQETPGGSAEVVRGFFLIDEGSGPPNPTP